MTFGRQKQNTGTCSRCEALPERSTAYDHLYLWLPLEHSATKLVKALRSNDWEYDIEDGVVVIDFQQSLEDLLLLLSETLSSTEVADTRCLLKDYSVKLSVRHIAEVQSLNHLYAVHESGWLLQMIEESRFTSHFQPIVYAEQPTEVFGYESLLRGLRDVSAESSLVSPGEIFRAAKRAGVLFQTDSVARRTAIMEAQRHGIEENLFINFTPTSIYDPEFCLRSTAKLIDQADVAHEKVVFEITESEQVDDTKHLLNIVDYYKSTGFKVALDDMGRGYSCLNLLHSIKPDFVKLDIQLIQGVTDDPYKATISRKLLEMAQDLGTKTVIEGVETEEELTWARENGATFVQGYLIAKPSSPPPLMVSEKIV